MRHLFAPFAATLLLFVVSASANAAAADKPSRAAEKGCKWEKLTSPTLGFDAWTQRCDFGSRKINLYAKDNKLMKHWSDGGEDSALVESFALNADETAEAAIKRVFAQNTQDKSLVARCLLKPYQEEGADPPKLPPGVKHYMFVPNAQLQKELDAKQDDGVPDPPCGDWGYAPDGIQYFETQQGARAILFVRVGQDEPLFDEQTLRLAPPQKP
jgi:hypothetical protein